MGGRRGVAEGGVIDDSYEETSSLGVDLAVERYIIRRWHWTGLVYSLL